MCASEQRDEAPVICDTVVVNYFVAVGRFELLADVLGGTVRVPTAVFDPHEDPGLADEALSELRRGLALHERRASDVKVPRSVRERSAGALPHFRQLDDHAAAGTLEAISPTGAELAVYAELRDSARVRRFGVRAALGRGEAAMLAIASSRGLPYATDDNDAIEVGKVLLPGVSPWRIRGLLIESVGRRLCSRAEAKEAHHQMVAFGFWDRDEL